MMTSRLLSLVPGLASLRWRLTISIAGLILFCTAISLVGADLFLTQALTDRTTLEMRHTLVGVRGYISNQRTDLLGTAHLVADDPVVEREAVTGGTGALVVHLAPFYADLNADILDVIDVRGRVVVRMEDTQTSGDRITSLSSVRKALNGREVVVTERDPSQRMAAAGYALRATVPILKNGQVVGAVVLGRKLGSIFASRIGHALDADVNIIAGNQRTGTTLTGRGGSLQEGVPEPRQILQRVAQDTVSIATLKQNGQTVLSGIVPLQGNSGGSVGAIEIVRPLGPIYDVIRTLSWLLLLLGAIVVAAGTALALSLSRRLTSRLSVLDATASRVASMAETGLPLGKLHVAEAVHGNDEVSSLAKSFAAMMTALDKHMSENEHLYAASQARVRELTGLAEVARLLTAAAPVRETLDALGEHVCRLVGCQAVAIWLPNDADAPALHGGYGLPAEYEALAREVVLTMPSAEFEIASQEALRTGEIVYRALENEPDSVMIGARVGVRQVLLDQGLRGATAVPLLLQNRIVGAMSCFTGSPDRLGTSELNLLKTVADQVAVAVENARLAEEGQARAALQAALEERRIGEEALRASEVRYRTMIEQSPLGIQIFAPDGTLVAINTAWADLFRLDGSTVGEYNILNATAVQELGQLEGIRRVFAGESVSMPPVRYDLPWVSLNRDELEYRWIQSFGYALKDAEDQVREVILMHEDITERLTAEEQLREKEEQYRSVFESSVDGLIIGDLEGKLIEANPAMCQMHGYSREELLSGPPTTFIHPDDHPQLEEYFETILAGVSYRMLAHDVRKDGTIFPVEVYGSGFMYKGRRHVLGVVRDITERVEAEKQLLAKEAQYRGIFESTSDALVIVNDRGQVVEVNPAACAMYGYPREEMIGRENALDIAAVEATLDRGAPFMERTVNTRQDGTPFDVEGKVTRLMYRGAMHYLIVARDVTEQVKAYDLLEQRVEERTRELSTLLEVSHNVASTLELQPLLSLILDQLRTVVDYSSAAILSLQDDQFIVLDRRMPGGMPAALGPDRYALQSAQAIVDVVKHGTPVVVEDARSDEPMAVAYRASLGEHFDSTFHFERAVMIVPLMFKHRMIGALSLSHADPNFYTEAHAALVGAIASHAAVAIENARLYEQAQDVAVLEERQRLARELHDSVSQALYGIALGAKTARTLLDRDPSKVAEPLEYVLSQAHAGLTEMRALIFELRPESLEAEGLIAALQKQAEALRARHGIDVRSDLDPEPDVPMVVKEAVYRIAQEAMHNTLKHARAHSVDLRLCAIPEGLELEVSDDGAGFETGGSFPGHLGLRTMRERAIRLGGTFTVTSAPGEGTSITVRVPVNTGSEVGLKSGAV